METLSSFMTILRRIIIVGMSPLVVLRWPLFVLLALLRVLSRLVTRLDSLVCQEFVLGQ